MNIYTDISVDLAGRSMTQIVRAVKGDTGRILRIHIRNSGKPYLIDPDCYGVLMGKKPDGTSLYNACRIQDNAIEYPFTDQTCAREGSFPVQIRLYGPQKKLITTVPIQMDVYPTSFDAECAAASANEQTALDDLVSRTHALELDLLHDRETGAFLGESAYQTAVRLGFQGTEEAWLASLRYDHSEEFTRLAAQVRDDGREAQNAAQAASAASEAAAESKVRAGQSAMDAGKAAEASAEQAAEAGKQTGLASGAAETARAQAQTARTEADRAKAEADKATQAALDAQTLLDDTQITDQKTTSSRKLYDTLCMPFEVSGPVVTCHPVPGYPLHVVSELPVVQEGSGDPSPDNVRPFLPTKKVELVVCGENLVSTAKLTGVHGSTTYKDGELTCTQGTPGQTFSAMVLKLGNVDLRGKTLYFRNKFQNNEKYKFLCVRLYGSTESGRYTETLVASFPRTSPCSVNVRKDAPIMDVRLYIYAESIDGKILPLGAKWSTRDVMLSFGDIPYVPYQGETFTAAFPEPLLGGKLDWTGKITPRDVITIRKSMENNFVPNNQTVWTETRNQYMFGGVMLSTKIGKESGAFTHGETEIWPTAKTDIYAGFASYAYFLIGFNPKVYGTKSEFFDYCEAQYNAGTPVQFVYEPETPKTVNADVSGSPLGLPGENNLYSDTGNTTVSGRSDPICVVSDLISQVADLNEIVTNIPKP